MDNSTLMIVLGAIGLLIFMVLAQQPIWLALLTAGALGIYLLRDSYVMEATLGSVPLTSTATYSLIIIPMFILMGMLASKADLAEDVYAVAARLTRRIPGGVGIATILACGGFSAVTGSSAATVATVGRISIAQMVRHGYKAEAAAAIVAVGGTLGVLIPPSVVLVVYGILTGVSIGQLLLAGIIPGIVSIIMYSVAIVALYRRGTLREIAQDALEPELVAATAGATTSSPPRVEAKSGRRKDADLQDPFQTPVSRRNIMGTFYVLLLGGVIIVGIYSGIFTAGESGAIAAALALVILIGRYARTPKKGAVEFWGALVDTASMTSMIFALLIGGGVFAFFVAASGAPSHISGAITEAGLPAWLLVLLILGVMVILGMFLDGMSILVIVIPLAFPILSAAGVDGIWFGILVVKAIEIGLISPPVGLNVFVAAGSWPGLKVGKIFRHAIPIGAMDFVTIAVLMAFPALVTWLPSLVYST